jgi:succinoglycan biosynthesis protein ExoA
MPIRNEEKFIERSLGAVLNQDYPPEYIEVIVADGLSDDKTIEIINSLHGRNRVRIIPNPARVQAPGLNAAIRAARGKFIIRVDGHTIIAPDYVNQCIETLHRTGADNVGGPMTPVGTTWIGQAIAAAGRSPFAVPSAFHISSKPQFTDTVYLGAWPRRVFDEVGLYTESLVANEDYELNYRIRQAGGKIFLTPAIRSEYYGRQTLPALAKQYFKYGRYKVRMLAEHPRSVRPRHLVAPLFIIGLLISLLLTLFFPFFGVILAGGVSLYAMTSIIFSLHTAAQHGWKFFPLLPIVFLTIHFSWGLGFWAELFKSLPHLESQPSENG